jgi:hypothetical protein
MKLPAFGRVADEDDRALMERMAQAYVERTPER